MRVILAGLVVCVLGGCSYRPGVKVVAESSDLKRVCCRVEVTL